MSNRPTLKLIAAVNAFLEVEKTICVLGVDNRTLADYIDSLQAELVALTYKLEKNIKPKPKPAKKAKRK